MLPRGEKMRIPHKPHKRTSEDPPFIKFFSLSEKAFPPSLMAARPTPLMTVGKGDRTPSPLLVQLVTFSSFYFFSPLLSKRRQRLPLFTEW